MTLIPKKIKEKYRIVKWKDAITISDPFWNAPNYVKIDFDKKFEVTKNEREIQIKNSKCCVSLSKNYINIHMTIF